ncbi:MAG: ATP-binding protein [Chlorobi bacterium]|nr:ATP-binding protein [Chlorobiota bacterium]
MKVRRIYQDLKKFIQPNKALLIFGPRQVGKTTLMEDFISETNDKTKVVTGDDITIHNVLSSQSLKEIKSFCEGYELIAIDEAQKIPNIGIALKLMVDQIPGIKIIATGSSSFELAGQTGEPLTGRKTTLMLFPIAQMEMLFHLNEFELKEKLEDFLIYGSYPTIITSKEKEVKIRLLNELVGSYLFKDILDFERIKNPQVLIDLLRLLAFQIGSEVSINELSQNLKVDNKTVKRYIELLEKAFIIYVLHGYSSNLRKEISKKSKYYFYDTGIRNAVIANFNPLVQRNDTGQLWENFLVIERIKKQKYTSIFANNYFWRSWTKKEVDWVEEREGKLYGFEFKWSLKKLKPPKLWLDTYPEASWKIIDKDNYLDFVAY